MILRLTVSRLWVTRGVEESKIMSRRFKVGDIEVWYHKQNIHNIFLIVDKLCYDQEPRVINHLDKDVKIESLDKFQDKYFAKTLDYKYLKDNKLNRKLYEVLYENGDYFVGRKV